MGTATDLQRRPDASMSLLTDLFANSLEQEYAEAAHRRAARSPSSRDRRTAWAGVVGVLLVGLVLSAAAVQARRSEPALSAERASLATRVQAQEGRVAELDRAARELQAGIAQLEERRLSGLTAGDDLREAVERLGTVAGTTEVTGPGVVVTVDDAPPDAAGEVPEGGRVLDFDMQQLVNGLWAAGAEAVDVGGQRLTSLTAIRSANDVVLVNYRPLAPPYRVRAIGDPRTLPARFADGPGGAWFRTIAGVHGVRFDVSTAEELTLPAGGTAALRHATVAEDS